MRPAEASRDSGHLFIAFIGIRMDVTVIAFEELLWKSATPSRLIDEHPDRIAAVLYGTVYPHVGIRGVLSPGFVEYLNRCLIDMQMLLLEEFFLKKPDFW